uniref:Uncharacterized protein n=1 Tax=Anopheles atroparvus TaxID=41427 RepID=A0A182IL73_ANOAO
MRAIFALLFVAIFALLGDAATTCGENETFQRCGTGCERRCDNPDDWNTPCELPCVDKCFCNEGFLRHVDGECVRAWRCDPTSRR